ncbi:hypothetical protein TWF696_008020 [Orbilia brochopaga]|uniref:Uncharacterized protein n=1 Tax=Orbilia brochopaga TaxID=3140254 RepID=A0AAV9UNB9_9PEZI
MHKMADFPVSMRHPEPSIPPLTMSSLGHSPDDRRLTISELESASSTSPLGHAQPAATDTQSIANPFEPTPSALPPAYMPSSPECRSSRIYDLDDLTDDLERAAPPPPYAAPLRQQSMSNPFVQDHHSEGADGVQYENMSAYIKAAKRRRMCAAVTLAAIIIVGIILIGNFIAKLGDSNSPDSKGS